MYIVLRAIVAISILLFLVREAQQPRRTINDDEGPAIVVRVVDKRGRSVITSTNPRVFKPREYTCPNGLASIEGLALPVSSFPVTVAVEMFDNGGIWHARLSPPQYVDVEIKSPLLREKKSKLGGREYSSLVYLGSKEHAYRRRVFVYELHPKAGEIPMPELGWMVGHDYYGNSTEFFGPTLFIPDYFCSNQFGSTDWDVADN